MSCDCLGSGDRDSTKTLQDVPGTLQDVPRTDGSARTSTAPELLPHSRPIYSPSGTVTGPRPRSCRDISGTFLPLCWGTQGGHWGSAPPGVGVWGPPSLLQAIKGPWAHPRAALVWWCECGVGDSSVPTCPQLCRAQLWGRDSAQPTVLCHSVSPQVTQPCHLEGHRGGLAPQLWLVTSCHRVTSCHPTMGVPALSCHSVSSHPALRGLCEGSGLSAMACVTRCHLARVQELQGLCPSAGTVAPCHSIVSPVAPGQ